MKTMVESGNQLQKETNDFNVVDNERIVLKTMEKPIDFNVVDVVRMVRGEMRQLSIKLDNVKDAWFGLKEELENVKKSYDDLAYAIDFLSTFVNNEACTNKPSKNGGEGKPSTKESNNEKGFCSVNARAKGKEGTGKKGTNPTQTEGLKFTVKFSDADVPNPCCNCCCEEREISKEDVDELLNDFRLATRIMRFLDL